ncbi:unnamed protein product [Tilletia controversa]|uniref:Uncharacterized protein n=3 Tax=Tilletia TaxID=13289 RepID=A0A8X7T164_9BASI|nr:hypothetical protein CF336_g930 [Tilletia laevis]KAE8200642.1 hypothetical protein CF328_g2910 [Tilletia controversa]CAD6884961.1 unnamed protein product [Tilletia caries]KAE8205808.1 hypothetical protein CF335_g2182 [Tilletia laevis]KAE8255502.1 hypothetical protein A4X06_0g388 [Tilletia controversa]
MRVFDIILLLTGAALVAGLPVNKAVETSNMVAEPPASASLLPWRVKHFGIGHDGSGATWFKAHDIRANKKSQGGSRQARTDFVKAKAGLRQR